MARASHAAPSELPVPAAVVPGEAPLSRVAVGSRRTVVAVDGPVRAELEREGVLPGSAIVVLARTPLGGPVIIELGRARLAVSADVAARIRTAAAAPEGRSA